MTAHRPVREYRFWSVILGCNACRLSMPAPGGLEYFMIIPRPTSGREWRDARRAAVEALTAAADANLDPGEIVIGDAEGYPSSPFQEQFQRDAADERARGVDRGSPVYQPAPGVPGPPRSESSQE
jgi:hypothetical protein